jgi:sulfur relay protein TusB/DsrH
MILHTVNKIAPCLARCMALATPGDTILLIEEAAYAAVVSESARHWEEFAGYNLCVLEDDLAVRGLSATILPEFKAVNWQDFVALTAAAEKVISWG